MGLFSNCQSFNNCGVQYSVPELFSMNRNNNLSGYVSEIPDEIRSVIKGLDSETRIAIIVALMKNSKLTFSELKECLGLNSSSLSSHLSILQDGGLVINFLEWNEKSYSYYMITDLAKTILELLFGIVMQNPKVNELWEQQLPSQEETQMQRSKYLELALQGQFAKDVMESIPEYQLVKNPETHSGHAKNK